MNNSNYESDYNKLEKLRIRLENSVNQEIIKACFKEYGYTAEKINEGWEVLNLADNAYKLKKKETIESTEVSGKYKNARKEINKQFKKDKKLSKAIFNKKPEMFVRMGINGSTPRAYIKWIETVNTFYSAALEDEDIGKSFALLNITNEKLLERKAKLAELKILRTDFLREKGESQESTANKDKAFVNLDDWMREFVAVAKIALEDHPQLLEALHIKP